MAKKTEKKTNAMRILDGTKIEYDVLTYPCDGVNFDGCLVAEQVGLSAARVFKTLVTVSDKKEIVVCCVPVDKKLDLKALASAASCKRLEMVPVDDILKITGYIRGGCSPVGMKKKYPTYIDKSALDLEEIAVSAGIRGQQVYLASSDLIEITQAVPGSFAVEQDT